MKINSDNSRALASRILDNYGSWSAVREAGERRADGVIVVSARPRPPAKPKSIATAGQA